MYRLLELVHAVTGHKDPRHVSLFDADNPWAAGISLAGAQKPYLVVGGDVQDAPPSLKHLSFAF
jgi:hypothetical protein